MAGIAVPQEAGDDPGRLLDLARKAQGREGHRLLGQAIKAIAEDKMPRTQAELDALLERLAGEIERLARSQNDILAIFGEKNRKTVARQVYFRRYREQWTFEQPPRLAAVFDCIKGQDPKVLSVFASREK